MRLAVLADRRVVALTGDDRGVDVGALLPGWTPEIQPDDVGACLGGYLDRAEDIAAHVADAPATIDLTSQRFAAPSPRPRALLAAPVNFQSHQGELGARSPQSSSLDIRQLGLIVMAPGSVTGPDTAIELPDLPGRDFHFEGEVAVVIGRHARGVSREDAMTCVLGYTGMFDVTMRLTEEMKEDRSMRKSYATFNPMGPCVLTADEVDDPATLELRTTLNAELKQEGSLRNLILDVPELVSRASRILPLEPGDVIATGTPKGVGSIVPGDELALEITRVGCLRMRVERRAW